MSDPYHLPQISQLALSVLQALDALAHVHEFASAFLSIELDHLLFMFLFLLQDPSQEDAVVVSGLQLLHALCVHETPSFLSQMVQVRYTKEFRQLILVVETFINRTTLFLWCLRPLT